MQAIPDDLFNMDERSFPAPQPTASEKKTQAAKEKEDAKAAKAATPRTRAAPQQQQQPQPQPQQKALTDRQRAVITLKISLYFQHFGERLSFKQPAKLPKDDESLQELLLTIETELSSAGGIGVATQTYLGAVNLIEQGSRYFNPLNLQLEGPVASFSATVAQNRKQWEDIVTECAIANAEWFMVGPVKRLLGVTFMMAQSVDAANKAGLARERPLSAEEKKLADELL